MVAYDVDIYAVPVRFDIERGQFDLYPTCVTTRKPVSGSVHIHVPSRGGYDLLDLVRTAMTDLEEVEKKASLTDRFKSHLLQMPPRQFGHKLRSEILFATLAGFLTLAYSPIYLLAYVGAQAIRLHDYKEFLQTRSEGKTSAHHGAVALRHVLEDDARFSLTEEDVLASFYDAYLCKGPAGIPDDDLALVLDFVVLHVPHLDLRFRGIYIHLLAYHRKLQQGIREVAPVQAFHVEELVVDPQTGDLRTIEFDRFATRAEMVQAYRAQRNRDV